MIKEAYSGGLENLSNAIQSLGVLHNNPFIFAPLFSQFYKSLGEKPKSFLLSYLVLPLVLYPKSRAFLENVRSTSSLRTLMSKRGRIYGLDERIAEYRGLTNISLQYAVDMGTLQVGENISVDVVSDWTNDPMCSPDQLKAASNLGHLFAPFDVPTIYRTFGVKKL